MPRTARVFRNRPSPHSQPPLTREDREKRIKDAIDTWRGGETKSLLQAAKMHGVEHIYSTVRRRCEGLTLPRDEAHAKQRHLTPAQEEVLIDWMKFLGATGRPISKETVRPYVYDMCGKYPSEFWIRRFIKRHPEVKLRRPSGLDPKRAQMFNYTVVKEHFEKLDAVLKEHGIPWENVYNMDEKGIQLGGGRKSNGRKFFFSRSDRQRYQIKGGNLELVTVIECVCADGTSLVPGFIFAGGTIDREATEIDPKISLATSENGWTNDFLCSEWFKTSFIPQVSAKNISGKPCLLIYDGHGSHITSDVVETAAANNIHLFCLPPHTTHRLQPLDVGVFGPVQKAWTKRCEQYSLRTGEGMRRCDVVKEYMEARKESFTENTILQAWRKSGIRPLDPGIFNDDDYAPSNSTSTSDQLPPSFPAQLPSDWDIPSSEDPDFDPSAQQSTSRSDVVPDSDFDSESSTSESADPELNPNINSDSDSGEMDIDEWRLCIAEQESFNSQERNFRPPTPSDTNGSGSLHLLRQRTGPVTRSLSGSLSGSRSATPFSSISFSNRSWSSGTSTRVKHYEEEIERLRAENERMKAESEEMKWQRDNAVGHAVMLRRDYNTLKQRLNAKEDRQHRQGRGLQMHGLMTSEQARQKIAEEDARRAEKKQKADAAKKRREDKEAARRVQRNAMDGTEIYTGRLSAKSKSELEDIATALSLSTEGTKSEILERIKGHLENTPDLRQDHRFSGLYTSRGNRAPHESNGHAGSSRIDHTAPIQATPSQQLVPSISHAMHSNGAPFSSQAAQQMNGPLPFPSFNPPPAYPLHYPGRETRFMQPVPAPEGARPLRTSQDLPPQLHAGPSTGRYMPYPLHGLPAPLNRVSANNDHSAHPSVYY